MSATVPIWLVVLDPALRRRLGRNWQLSAGLLAGCLGIVLLAQPANLLATVRPEHYTNALLSVVFMLCGCICWSYGSLYGRRKPAPPALPATMFTAAQMLCGGLLLLFVSLLTGEWPTIHPAQFEPMAWVAVAYLVVFGSVIGFSAYSWLFRTQPPARVGTYAYVNPAVAVWLGWLLANEPITWYIVLAMCLILCGVLLIHLGSRK